MHMAPSGGSLNAMHAGSPKFLAHIQPQPTAMPALLLSRHADSAVPAICHVSCLMLRSGWQEACVARAGGSSPPPLAFDPSPAASPPFPPLPMLVPPPCPDFVSCCRERLPAITQIAQVSHLTAAAGHWTLTREMPVATPACREALSAFTQTVHVSSQSASGGFGGCQEEC